MIQDNKYNQKQLVLIILQQSCKLLGINLEVNHCIKCGNNKLKTISFRDRGMLCNLCFDTNRDKLFDLSLSKLIHYLFNEKYAELVKYINEWDFGIKLLSQFINDNVGILLNTLRNY
jgi:recombinational DNA repair protein (RecF pathway)